MNHRFLIVDVFTDTAMAGNQLAVFTNAVGLSEDQMQALALEVGFSETVFVFPSKVADFHARIFTPAKEIPFAGHPVLGAAFAMAGPLQSSLVHVETGSGVVPVVLEREGAIVIFGRMQQPLPTVEPWPDAEPLLAALGLASSRLPVEVYDNGIRHVFVAVSSFAEVAALKPDFAALESVASETGVNVFAVEDGRIKTRMFWTDLGVGEDAATGSAAGPLAVHLARHGAIDWGQEVEIAQGAEIGRPSYLYASAHGSADGVTGVEVAGAAVVVAKGEFKL